MRDVSCKLLSTQILKDSIGAPKAKNITEAEIPIIKVEDVYASEFYKANEQGYKPSIRLRISSLNYENQPELIYMSKTYTIIRVQEITADEIVLICERKLKNVKGNKN